MLLAGVAPGPAELVVFPGLALANLILAVALLRHVRQPVTLSRPAYR